MPTVGTGIASWAGGLSASGVASAAASTLATAAAGALVNKALAPKPQEQVVKPLNQQDKPQTAQEVDLGAIQKKNAQLAAAAGALGGANSTLLTSASGVDSSTLNLGRSTLLGQ